MENREGRNRRVGTAGAAMQAGQRTKLLLLLGYVSKYGGFYGRRLGIHATSETVGIEDWSPPCK